MKARIDLAIGRLSVVVTPESSTSVMLDLVARIASRSYLRVLDGGNSFNAYNVARGVGRLTPHITTAMSRIQVARAFTCYQMLELIKSTPAGPSPIMVLKLLSTFYDENVPLDERRRLLEKAIKELRRLSSSCPVGVSVRLPRAGQADSMVLVDMIAEAGDQLWRFEAPRATEPMTLFTL